MSNAPVFFSRSQANIVRTVWMLVTLVLALIIAVGVVLVAGILLVVAMMMVAVVAILAEEAEEGPPVDTVVAAIAGSTVPVAIDHKSSSVKHPDL